MDSWYNRPLVTYDRTCKSVIIFSIAHRKFSRCADFYGKDIASVTDTYLKNGAALFQKSANSL